MRSIRWKCLDGHGRVMLRGGEQRDGPEPLCVADSLLPDWTRYGGFRHVLYGLGRRTPWHTKLLLPCRRKWRALSHCWLRADGERTGLLRPSGSFLPILRDETPRRRRDPHSKLVNCERAAAELGRAAERGELVSSWSVTRRAR